MVIWNTGAAKNGLVILTMEAFQKTGGTDSNPVLSPISIPVDHTHLPLQIDNRRPVPRMFNFREGMARFSPSEEIITGSVSGLSACGDMAVVDGQPDRNECLIVSYSIEDGAGNPHPHLRGYGLWMEYSPRQEPGVPISAGIPLRGGGSNPPYITEPQHKDIDGSYSTSMTGAPLYSVHNYESVLVPRVLNGWPPEASGDTYSGLTPCTQYAAEVSLGCSVRTVNGWGGVFGRPHISRHIIIRRS
jgi:hypothetical protein